MLEIISYLRARYMSERAQGIVEYALILAFVTIVAAGLINSDGLQATIKGVSGKVTALLNKAAAAK